MNEKPKVTKEETYPEMCARWERQSKCRHEWDDGVTEGDVTGSPLTYWHCPKCGKTTSQA